MEPDRFLSGFRSEAGLVPKAPKYEGWESLGVAGQTLGHYLSACAMYYATSGDERFLQRLEYTINELDSCQQANGDGYLAATPDGKGFLRRFRLERYIHRIRPEWRLGTSVCNA